VQGLQPPTLKHMQTPIMWTQPWVDCKFINRTEDWIRSNQNFRLHKEKG
jgi:hypothetical protein